MSVIDICIFKWCFLYFIWTTYIQKTFENIFLNKYKLSINLIWVIQLNPNTNYYISKNFDNGKMFQLWVAF